jgi:hypothetical protein
VGSNDPDALTKMEGATVGSRKHVPARIKPERGQVSENNSEPARSEHWGVLHSDKAGLHFANHARHLPPESTSLSVQTLAPAGSADVLAREASRNHVSNSAPWPAVKSPHVIPDREWLKVAVVLASHENACGVSVEFDSAHGGVSEQFAREYSSTRPREESEFS